MILIHNTSSFSGNIDNIPTLNTISPYLQIIDIKNAPLTPRVIINIYMSSKDDDKNSKLNLHPTPIKSKKPLLSIV